MTGETEVDERAEPDAITTCRGVHNLFGYCHCCNKPGPYYFGDRMATTGLGGKARWQNRAEVLERVLETIEDNYSRPGDTFDTYTLARQAGVWGSRVYQALRWLEHHRFIARLPRKQNTLNVWFVLADMGGAS